MAHKKEKSYKELKQELDAILVRMQQEDTDIDEAMKLHEQGQAIHKQMDTYLAKIAKDANLQSKTE